jgi:Na+/H+ antiporter NhaD/arsenite permease-like protein
MNFVTAPLIADLFLLAIGAITRTEVRDGTLGANNISPLDIMGFFLTLAYIAISIDASGLIRYLAFKVLQKGGKVGHKLFLYLYCFFFGLGSFIGNDPIILSGTAFLAYMTRVSSNIIHPRAWIYTQFAVANTASAILVSSNPTNLVLSGAFSIKFITYTVNMIVPVIVTAIVLFPFLLYVVFADESLIPLSIKMHELSEEAKARKPVNPNIPNARGIAEEQEKELANREQSNLLSLEEIMNPFLDKGGAWFGGVVMAATLVTLLTLNAVSQASHEHPVYWVTLPAAFIMFCWDVAFGWLHRHETREIARKGREELERARTARENREMEETERANLDNEEPDVAAGFESTSQQTNSPDVQPKGQTSVNHDSKNSLELPDSYEDGITKASDGLTTVSTAIPDSSVAMRIPKHDQLLVGRSSSNAISVSEKKEDIERTDGGIDIEKRESHEEVDLQQHKRSSTTLKSMATETYRWSQETFPTTTAVITHLPFALVPFALSMFVLVQGLVTRGWVPVFAYGWDHWVGKTGVVGSIGGMGFLSVVLCNVSFLNANVIGHN